MSALFQIQKANLGGYPFTRITFKDRQQVANLLIRVLVTQGRLELQLGELFDQGHGL